MFIENYTEINYSLPQRYLYHTHIQKMGVLNLGITNGYSKSPTYGVICNEKSISGYRHASNTKSN